MTDDRVPHLWDADNTAGRWLIDHVDDYAGLDWDFNMAFGPDGTWEQTPRPLHDAGFTVIANSDRLTATIATPVTSRTDS